MQPPFSYKCACARRFIVLLESSRTSVSRISSLFGLSRAPKQLSLLSGCQLRSILLKLSACCQTVPALVLIVARILRAPRTTFVSAVLSLSTGTAVIVCSSLKTALYYPRASTRACTYVVLFDPLGLLFLPSVRFLLHRTKRSFEAVSPSLPTPSEPLVAP